VSITSRDMGDSTDGSACMAGVRNPERAVVLEALEDFLDVGRQVTTRSVSSITSSSAMRLGRRKTSIHALVSTSSTAFQRAVDPLRLARRARAIAAHLRQIARHAPSSWVPRARALRTSSRGARSIVRE
jgi:hypothetical protein